VIPTWLLPAEPPKLTGTVREPFGRLSSGLSFREAAAEANRRRAAERLAAMRQKGETLLEYRNRTVAAYKRRKKAREDGRKFLVEHGEQ